ncbi:MAG: hypothetical protein COW73_06295 [Nitrospirae bacterium CG18_big_fil_WC_8_21_14_2_50_70_55]|nr:hypothetical protein [Deltaproteobacteria bacterium]OIP63713.1 MAG: hypothetical protein AUK30_07985 [Nitrospirae bacterium CG2_30_70_394]PIQ05287.1 MAG: hypothetical protein COW73_06295 [Nitrospirae bacterium CG18_big_fil_WC_8_21_14_2_50_70_55]PIU77264.1 MAG: hypothetical protein COS73_11500 [Nitrospirae bacterium CG06_land_8_20_14_3_00_70_43]PIW81942.1 MAG: hypothetical protein COZ96_11310 [Nitrospirae bacterium CG_4_8_14_3_um_filter_70_85]PIX83378.1 MAG: hypothetical protein COZ33_05785 
MDRLFATLWIYRRCGRRTVELWAHNLPVALAVVAYAVVIAAVRLVAAPLGWLGGLLVTLAACACCSSFLYLVAQVQRLGRVNLYDLQRGFTAYLGEVVNLGFVLWIAATAVRLAGTTLPNPRLVGLAFTVVVFVVANAVPEMIYQTHHTGLRLIAEGYHFITTNGLEWFPPTLVASAVAYALAAAVEMLGLPAALQAPVQMVAIGLLVYALALFRGLLFAELAATGSRGRVFRYRGRRR